MAPYTKTQPVKKMFTDVPLPLEHDEKPKRGFGVNQVSLIGRLVADPEVRKVGDGLPVAKLRLVTNERGEPEFHDVVAWARTAEVCAEYLIKGSSVFVGGHLKTRTYESRTGPRKATEIVVDNLQFLDRPKAA